MTSSFHKLFLSELRMVTYRPGDPAGMTDELLCKAVTLNENLRSMGYVLKPDDLLRLAASPSLEGFFEAFRALVPEVTAKPMYPGFPQQVMEMSEAEFRLHQMMHYFSTYDVELLLGKEVKRGWLPEYDGPERTGKDIALLECRVIALVAEADAPLAVLKLLLGRRERLTNPELELVVECAGACRLEQLQELKVRFKENLDLLFPRLMKEADRAVALKALRAICAHTGDVLRCSMDYLRQRRYHLSTSEKKLLVKLLEAYSAGDLKSNMMQSLRLRERNLLMLQHLDFNRYSRSPAHREAVRALRSGELLSWHGVGEALLREHSHEALSHLAQRPGYMLRMLNRLLSLGYAAADIEAVLLPRADAISGHLVVRTIRTLARRSVDLDAQHAREIESCRSKYAGELLNRYVPPIGQRLIHIGRNAERQRREAKERFFEEPKRRAHAEAYAQMESLRQEIDKKTSDMREKLALRQRMEDLWSMSRNARILWNANTRINVDMLYAKLFYDKPEAMFERLFQCQPSEVDAAIAALEEEIRRMEAELRRRLEQAEAAYKASASRIEQENAVAYVRRLEEIERWEETAKDEAKRAFERETAEEEERRRSLPKRRDAELTALEARYLEQKRASENDPRAVEILKALLKAHFRQVVTPLKGKKVFLDLDQFDLVHSTLETEDRSKDGGYIRSGICYRIPDDAKYVRFFVYWNDRSRVDVDLHAGALKTNGEHFHVGWNANFRESGVVYSGDITHSDAAEYVDIDLSAPLKEIYANVSLYYGKYSFKEIETCFMGMMAVNQAHQEVKLYDPKNCFFTHALTQNTRNLFYGYVDVQNRYVRFVGQPNEGRWDRRPNIESSDALFSLQDYLDSVLNGQGVERVQTRDEADVVLTMGKGLSDNGVSLVDSNFFLEC